MRVHSVRHPRDGGLEVVLPVDRADLGVPGELRHRHRIVVGSFARAAARPAAKHDPTGPFQSNGKPIVVSGIGCTRKSEVEVDAARPGGRQSVDKLRVIAPRPRPPADLMKRFIVDLDQDDVAARPVPVQAVAAGAKQILKIAQEHDAQQQADQGRPEQQLPRLWIRLALGVRRHAQRMRAKRLGKR